MQVTKYELVAPEEEDGFWGIKLLEGPLEGVVYRYGEIKFLGEDGEGNAQMSFEYEVLETGPFATKEEIAGQAVDKVMGDILQSIIIESLERDELKTKSDGNNREDSITEFDS